MPSTKKFGAGHFLICSLKAAAVGALPVSDRLALDLRSPARAVR
jgi:hypothetical protein